MVAVVVLVDDCVDSKSDGWCFFVLLWLVYGGTSTSSCNEAQNISPLLQFSRNGSVSPLQKLRFSSAN